jgi:hypothetical protein
MRFTDRKEKNADSYSLWLSADDTYRWANRAGGWWPCSDISGKRLCVQVDSNGLVGVFVNGSGDADIDGNELDAIVSDFLPASHRHLWPTWEARD